MNDIQKLISEINENERKIDRNMRIAMVLTALNMASTAYLVYRLWTGITALWQ